MAVNMFISTCKILLMWYNLLIKITNSLLLLNMKNFKGLHNLPILINKPDAKIS